MAMAKKEKKIKIHIAQWLKFIFYGKHEWKQWKKRVMNEVSSCAESLRISRNFSCEFSFFLFHRN